MVLVAAADTSDNFLYVSVIVGEEVDIHRTHSKYNMNHIHMNQIQSRKEKEAIVSSFSPVGNVFSACLKVDRYLVTQRILHSSKSSSAIKKRNIEIRFNYALRKKLHDVLDPFLVRNGHHIETVEFQVDKDLHKSFNSVGLACCNVGKAHELADIIGWANHGRIENSHIGEFDFVGEVERLTRKGA